MMNDLKPNSAQHTPCRDKWWLVGMKLLQKIPLR